MAGPGDVDCGTSTAGGSTRTGVDACSSIGILSRVVVQGHIG